VEPGEKREGPRTGDFYLTKHSNLCETHVVFHLVADEQLDTNGNMRSAPDLPDKIAPDH
jgi:hypothetical protein